MTDVAELENRIAAALERIGVGLDSIFSANHSEHSAADFASLTESLENEKTANAQLEERVIAIKEKQETLVAGLESQVANLREEVLDHDGAVQKMKRVNHRLRENNRALRDANREGVGDPDLINNGMVAELDGLRESRESDRAELDAILTELRPLIEGAASA